MGSEDEPLVVAVELVVSLAVDAAAELSVAASASSNSRRMSSGSVRSSMSLRITVPSSVSTTVMTVVPAMVLHPTMRLPSSSTTCELRSSVRALAVREAVEAESVKVKDPISSPAHSQESGSVPLSQVSSRSKKLSGASVEKISRTSCTLEDKELVATALSDSERDGFIDAVVASSCALSGGRTSAPSSLSPPAQPVRKAELNVAVHATVRRRVYAA